MDNETLAQILEDTTPTESMQTETEAEVDNTVPQVPDTDADETEQAAEVCGEDAAQLNPKDTESLLTVRFNHTDRALSRAEAVELAQKGLKLDSMADMLNDLSYLAAIQGKAPAEIMKDFIKAGEDLKRKEFAEKYGEDSELLDVLIENFRRENRQKLSDAYTLGKQAEAEAEQNLNRRIAEDFQKLKSDFPEIGDYASLPSEVKRQAAGGTPLKYAYLDYRYAEEKRINAAKAQAESAAKKSTGSLHSDIGANPTESALMRGLWR